MMKYIDKSPKMHMLINYAAVYKQTTPGYVMRTADAGETNASIPLCGTSMLQFAVPNSAGMVQHARNMKPKTDAN